MKSPLRVIHLEDDARDATLVLDALAAAAVVCDVTRVETREAFVAALESGGFDLILAEYALPSLDGLSALKIAQDVSAHLPFLFVSATLDEAVAVEALKAGARDYVFKNRLPRLPSSVRRALLEPEIRGDFDYAGLALLDSERNANLIVDNIPGLVALLTATGDVEMVNRQLFEYFGRSLADLRQWKTNDINHPDDVAQVVRVFERAIASGSPYETLQRLKCADGQYRWFTNRGSPVRADDGRITRWCVLLTDIHERKLAEEAVDKVRAELARVARVATGNALTASMAHEINQPLTGIVTNAGTCLRLLDADPPDIDGVRSAAERLIRDAKRTAEVIARLRALFSKQDFTVEPLSLSDVARDVIALTSADLHRGRVALDAELAEDLPLIDGDRIQLQQVVLNLLINALDAMSHVDDRARQVQIRTERDDTGYVRVSVRDTGVGIDPEHIDTLFTAFYSTKPGGMGIGLSISRSIVEQHKGHLWGEPNDGPGATFRFSIPVSAAPHRG